MLKRSLLLISVSLLLLMSGCSSDDSVTDICYYSFTDDAGNTVVLNNKPERVATLLGSFADIWQLSGGNVCATASDAWDDLGLTLDDAVNIGGAHSPNVELLLSSSPDFIIASSSTASHMELSGAMAELDIPIAYFDIDSFDDYLRMLDICTDITGNKDKYAENGTRLQNEIDSIIKEVKNNEAQHILLLRASAGSVKAKSSEGTVLGEMLDDLGCVNIVDEHSELLEDLNIEIILKEEPYRIFVVTMGNDTEGAKDSLLRMIKENPAWSSLEAVKNNRLHIMDRRLFNNKPNSRWAEAYEILADILSEN